MRKYIFKFYFIFKEHSQNQNNRLARLLPTTTCQGTTVYERMREMFDDPYLPRHRRTPRPLTTMLTLPRWCPPNPAFRPSSSIRSL